MPFICSICGEESTRICARCTKDACDNHLCEKCLRCSDCCECEVALSRPIRESIRPLARTTAAVMEAGLPRELEPDPDPEPPLPEPGPDPAPVPDEPGPVAP